MARLFTALPVPTAIGEQLALLRGGLLGARWVEPRDYHVTLRFMGDVDGGTARELAFALGETREAAPIRVELDALDVFGGSRPRAVYARVVPSRELSRLQAEHEGVARRVGLEPETRRFTPHVTLARLRDVRPGDAAGFLASAGRFPRLVFTAETAVLFSSRGSAGGGPYLAEAVYPFRPATGGESGVGRG